MNLDFLDREGIEMRKAAFSIDRFAEPEIEAAPTPAYNIMGKERTGKGLKSGALDRTFDAEPKPKKRERAPRNGPVMTPRGILTQLAAGRSPAQIAVAYRVKHKSVMQCLHREAKISPEIAAEFDGLVHCACGGPKLPERDKCGVCRRRRR